MAWRGWVGSGAAGRGEVWQGEAVEVGRGPAWQGMAGQGGLGMARRGGIWQGGRVVFWIAAASLAFTIN